KHVRVQRAGIVNANDTIAVHDERFGYTGHTPVDRDSPLLILIDLGEGISEFGQKVARIPGAAAIQRLFIVYPVDGDAWTFGQCFERRMLDTAGRAPGSKKVDDDRFSQTKFRTIEALSLL